MNPQDFITQWGAPGGVPGPGYALNEEQGAQSHFLGLCELLDVPKPGSRDDYRFEEKSLVIGGKTGYADVFMRGVFAWENKAPGKNLDAALKQLLTYSLALSNPPILVVSDRLTIRIHTQFTGYPSQTHTVSLYELDQPDKRALLRRIWTAPESFKPRETNRDITEAAAKSFATLAEGLRRRTKPGSDPNFTTAQKLGSEPEFPFVKSVSDPNFSANRVAHFLTQCLFCFFAEDVGLLPGKLFERLLNNRSITPAKLTHALGDLFTAMASGGMFGADDVVWFNGGLFQRIDVPQLTILDVTELRNAANLNWSAIDVSIFGTLFERGLDPAKRSQLGAHYTDTATIDRIIDPVLRRPLLQKWQLVAQEIKGLQAKSTKKDDKHYRAAKAFFVGWLNELAHYRVLDPACGSGNFLFLGLKALKDIEHQSHLDAAALGLDREADLVTGPHNVLGIELNSYAAELARVTVWIGELQWRMAHGYAFKTNPVLEPLDHIECRDALLSFHGGDQADTVADSRTNAVVDGRVEAVDGGRVEAVDDCHPGLDPGSMPAGSAPAVTEATWPRANIVIGNPPFLGGSKKRRELGDAYFDALGSVFLGRVPGGADLVCYWFDKARVAMETGGLEAAGLVATQSIRAGSNREVLTALGAATPIFNAWSDEPWVNEGAAVRVSLVCFGAGKTDVQLNGQPVPHINADLTGVVGLDLTLAKVLPTNSGTAFQGPVKVGRFDVDGATARNWLKVPNVHGKSNALVIRPAANGQDLAKRPSDTWVIDFGAEMVEIEAAFFEIPFAHVKLHVKPIREAGNRESRKRYWWLHGETVPGLRSRLQSIARYLATPRVAKHRFFVFLHASVLPDTRLNVIARADDTTFGILSSRIHEVWSLAQASMHGVGNDPTYNAKSCFETFPFPAGLTPADTASQQIETLPNGASIPQLPNSYKLNQPLALVNQAQVAINKEAKSAPSSSAAKPPAPAPGTPAPAQAPDLATVRQHAERIAIAAKRLNDLREAWLNPPEWTHKVPEVIPLGMAHSPYPDRIEAKPSISEQDRKALQKRTLTNLYNAKPAWLTLAHQQLDVTVAAAYGWADYTTAMPDKEILKRLLALNLARSVTISELPEPHTP